MRGTLAGVAGVLVAACSLVVPLDDLGPGDASKADVSVEGSSDAGLDGQQIFASVQLLHIGGDSPAGNESSIIAAEIQGDGTIGAWRNVRPLPSAMTNLHGGFAIGDTLYVIGNGTAISSRMQKDGSLDPWTSLTSAPDTRELNTTTYVNGYAVFAAGQDNNGYPRSVYVAPVDGGSVGAWKPSTSLAASDSGAGARAYHGAVASGDYVFLVAGMIEGSKSISSILSSQVASDGGLGPWTPTIDLPASGYCPHTLVIGGRLFVLGGTLGGNSRTSYVSVIDGGSLGAWTQSTSVDINAADNCGAFASYGSFVYVMGGESGGNYTDEVVFASIAAGGDVGVWAHTTPLPEGGRADGFAVVLTIP
jgi:hypothetical protein